MHNQRRFTLSLAATLAAFGVLVGTAYAELGTPKLRARARNDGSIRLSWSGVRAARDTLTVVEIERGATPTATSPLITLPPRPRKHFDVPPAPGVYWYRVRAVTDGQPSPWNLAVSATILPEATPVPLPTATPAPTAGGSNPNDPPLGSGQRDCRAGAIEETLDLINAARQDANVPALRDDQDLRWAARLRVITMATNQQLSHNGWVEVIQASGYRFSVLAENIAAGYWSPESVVQGWLDSSGHRTHMLNRAYRDSGIGCVIDQNGKLWWAHDLGG